MVVLLKCEEISQIDGQCFEIDGMHGGKFKQSNGQILQAVAA